MPGDSNNRYSDMGLQSSLLVAIALLAALWPAFYNGYPLLFSDSTQYLYFAMDPASAAPGHTGYNVYYPLVTIPSVVFRSAWLVIAIQAILAVAVLRQFFFSLQPQMKSSMALVLAATCLALTQASWLTSWVMPDIFEGLGILAILTLLFYRQKPSRAVIVMLVLVALLGALMSTGNLVAYVATITALSLAGLALRYWRIRKIQLHNVRFVGMGMLAALILAALPNIILYGKFTTNAGSSALVFARLAEVGLAQDFLKVACPENQYRICEHTSTLDRLRGVRQGFLWGEGNLAYQTEAWLDSSGEFSSINRQVILQNFPSMVSQSIESTFSVLAMSNLWYPTDDGNFRSYEQGSPVKRNIHAWYPNEALAFDTSRQQMGTLQLDALAAFYSFGQWLSYLLVILMLVVSLIRGDAWTALILIGTITFLLASAAVHAGLVGPFVRYQVKAAWVLWPVLLVAVNQNAGSWRRSPGA